MMRAEARRSAGSSDANSFSTERTSGESAGWTIAVAWKLMVAGGIGSHQRQEPAPAHRHRHRHPTAGRDVPGLPAVGGGRDVQPPSDGLVEDAAGSGLPRRRDVAEDRERGLGDLVPDLLGGQPSRHQVGCPLQRLRGSPPRLPRRRVLAGVGWLPPWPRLLTCSDNGARPSLPSSSGSLPAPVGANSRGRSGPLTDPEQYPCTQPRQATQDAQSNQALVGTEKTPAFTSTTSSPRLESPVAAKRPQSLTGSTSTSDDPAAAVVSFPAHSLVSTALRERHHRDAFSDRYAPADARKQPQ